MSQKRKDQDVSLRSSHMDQARGSGSVMDNPESFEHGSGTSDVARGMGSSGERGSASDQSDKQSQGGRSRERGRARSEE